MTWTFALVTSDAVVGGYLEFVLERVRAHGFQVGSCCLVEMDWPRLTRMYLHCDDPPQPQGHRAGSLPASVMAPLLRLAPACLLMVRHAAADPCEALLRCKGATHPDAAAAGTVRAAGENVIFNFMHCPDDLESATTELHYLVGPDVVAGLYRESALTDVEVLRRSLPAFTGWEALSFPMVVNRLEHRMLARLALCHESPDLQQAFERLREQRAALQTAQSAAERMRVAQEMHAPIHRALGAGADPGVASALDALAALHDIQGARRLQPILALGPYGIYLSELEKVVLDAHRHAYWSDACPLADLSG